MKRVGSDVNQWKERYILTTLAIMGYSELSAILRILKTVCQIPEEEAERYIKELESNGLIGKLQNKLFVTEKGVETLKEIGVDERVVENILAGVKITAPPFLLSLRKPSLTRLELAPIDAESLSNLVKLVDVNLKPLTPPLRRPRLIPLDTSELLVEKLPLETPVPKLVSLVKPRLKLTWLDSSQQAIEGLPLVLVNPLTIKLRPPKLINVDKSAFLHQLTTPITTSSEERELEAAKLEKAEEGISEDHVSSILEGFFELEEPDDIIGISGVMYDRPVIIVAIKPINYEYIDILRHILRVLYRIAVGGLPYGEYFTPTKPPRTGELLKENLEVQRVYFESTRRDVIKVVEFTGLDKSIDFELLRNRLREHLVEGLSFTVIYVDEELADDIIKFINYYRGEFGAEVIIIRPRRLLQEQLYKLAALSWGYVSILERSNVDEERLWQPQINASDPNSVFTFFAEKFYRDLKRVYSTAFRKGIAEIVKPSKQDVVRESTEHYLLKVFAAYYFVEKEGTDVKDIAVEETICGHITPDVYIKSRNIAIEIETLYGEGLAWPNKLRETIEKYRGCTGVSEIWLVLPPIQASVYSKYLVSIAKRLREIVMADVKVLTVDLGEEAFVPVASIGEQIKRIIKSQETPHF